MVTEFGLTSSKEHIQRYEPASVTPLEDVQNMGETQDTSQAREGPKRVFSGDRATSAGTVDIIRWQGRKGKTISAELGDGAPQ
jgi:hypothetical protein